MPVILETLSILSLSEDILTTVQAATISSIKRASLDALPAMVKFLISTCGNNYDDVINGNNMLFHMIGYFKSQFFKKNVQEWT